ncbi:MAG: iron-containing alcohol dehydrogenase [Syntrophobacteraceae bacterium]
MSMNFEFTTANRILFGPGTLREVASIAVHLGNRALIVTGRSPDRASTLVSQLESKGISVFSFTVGSEPTLETVQSGAGEARANGCEFIAGFGGGSVIDTGKAIAALLANKGELLDYLEVIGKGRPLTEPSLPYIAIPTTAGTGSEVTRNAVLASPEHRVKVSLRSPYMLPRAAVIDPELTRSLPPSVTAATGLDALTQLIEPYVCNSPNPLTDALCREGIRRVSTSLRRAWLDGDDLNARTDMSLASLFSGMALANAKLGAVHGLAGPLGGVLSAPHGAICARLLPFVMETNLKSIEKRAPGSPALPRYSAVARLLTGEEAAGPADGVLWLQSLCREFEIPTLSRQGLSRQMIPAIANQAMRSSSMKGNPIEVNELELSNILEQAM